MKKNTFSVVSPVLVFRALSYTWRCTSLVFKSLLHSCHGGGFAFYKAEFTKGKNSSEEMHLSQIFIFIFNIVILTSLIFDMFVC